MQTPFYALYGDGAHLGVEAIMPHEPGSRRPNAAFATADATRMHIAGALNRQMRRARADSHGNAPSLRPLGARLRRSPERLTPRDIAAPGSRLDAAIERGTVNEEFQRVRADAQMALFVGATQQFAAQRRARRGDALTADAAAMARESGADIAQIRELARRADADLGPAGGLVENLTAFAFRYYVEPQPPLHAGDIFTFESGINIGNLAVQMLFQSMTGEAKVYDPNVGGGAGGGYALGGPGFRQETLQIVHFLSEHPLNFIEEAREGVMMLSPQGIREENGRRSHATLHNRLAWGIGTSIPADLPVRGLRAYPGLRLAGKGYTTSGITGQQLLNEMNAALSNPRERSSQAYDPRRLAITVGLETLATTLRITDGDATTVMDAFVRSHPGVQIDVVWELKDLVASTTEGIFGFPGDGDANPIYLHSPAMALPVFSDGLNMIMRWHSASAGLFIPSTAGAEMRYITRS